MTSGSGPVTPCVEPIARVQYTEAMRALPTLSSLALVALVACGSNPPPPTTPVPSPTVETPGALTEAPATAGAVAPAPDPDLPIPLAERLGELEGEALVTAVEATAPDALRRVVELLDPRSAAAGWVDVRLGRLAAHRRDLRGAREHLRRAEAVGGAPGQAARETLARLDAREAMVPGRIGVLLPLSGPYARIGEAALMAIRLALTGVEGVEIVVVDTAGDADRAPRVVESLVYEQRVAAIIGPVGSIESYTAARAAERLEVPIIVLSSRADLTRLGTFVFRHRLTRRAQAETIGRHAVEALGLKTFAILYPESDYGREMMQVFWETVTRLGGEVRGAQGYSVNVNEQNEPIKKLIGRHHLDARRVDPHWEALNRKSKDKAQHVAPVVDFEALFIPDGGERVRLLLPFLAYWDVEIRTGPQQSPLELAAKYGGDTPQLVQILGGSGFNDPRLTHEPPESAIGALFVDGFHAEAASAAPFVEAWVAEHGRRPPVLAAHAYDAARLLATVVPGIADRDAVRRAIAGVGGYSGVFGDTRVESDGEITFDLQVLTLDGFHGVVPAPTAAPEPSRDGYFEEDAPRN